MLLCLCQGDPIADRSRAPWRDPVEADDTVDSRRIARRVHRSLSSMILAMVTRSSNIPMPNSASCILFMFYILRRDHPTHSPAGQGLHPEPYTESIHSSALHARLAQRTFLPSLAPSRP